MSLGNLIRSSVKCVKCGAGYGQCGCWTRCTCGRMYETAKGPKDCGNPVHRCERKNKRGERCFWERGHKGKHDYAAEPELRTTHMAGKWGAP